MSTEQLYTKGTGVWIADKEIVWRAGIVIADIKDNKLRVFQDNGKAIALQINKISQDLPPLRNPDILIGADDLTTLSYLHEPAGIVLVAINPYEHLSIYGDDFIMQYRGQNMGELDPHIFAVAEDAFSAMTRDDKNQSVIISGESGAGKTVSAKFTMRYLASVGGSTSETQIEKKVLASNPIMEAFGNAKTIRNDNSSRFGKFIEINFDKLQRITGASMRTYLLEKSRVVYQAEDERNYHIFYQLCYSSDQPYLEEMCLSDPDDFYYTQQGRSPKVESVDDRECLQATMDAFETLGVTSEHQRIIFRSVAAILHLGNVKFMTLEDEPDECFIMDDDPALLSATQLLSINFPQLQKWLCNRKISTMHEIITKPLTSSQATTARDGLAKLIYSKLFDWIVQIINEVLVSSGKSHTFIGVLDIYGFEYFDWNSFEQFCINFANEKLQQQFCAHVFKLEQEEYTREEIEWNFIDYYDNQPCIELVEGKMGIMALLDEECKVQGTDKNWIQKLYNNFGNKKCQYFSKPRTSQSSFIVHHFCGDVIYECYGFIEKNKDTIFEEYLSILRGSEFEVVADMFHDKSDSRSRSSTATGARMRSLSGSRLRGIEKKRLQTVGSQFINSVGQLMATLNNTKPHYVRTIKPNPNKAAFTYEPTLTVQQLRACGIIETIKISSVGYPSRWTYIDFYTRYRVLAKLSSDIDRSDLKKTCANIVKAYVTDEDKLQFGRTKIFFRAGQVAFLEKLRSEKLHRTSIMIQKFIKGWQQRKRYLQIRCASIKIQSLYRGLRARRLLHFLRCTKAATNIQRFVRGYHARRSYKFLRRMVIHLQCLARTKFARKKYMHLLRTKKATIVQKYMRGWISKVKYRKTLKAVILLQCSVRRLIAKRELKKLKIEARSVAHLQELQRGMENKVISLQLRLTEQQKENELLNQKLHETDELKEQLSSYKDAKVNLTAAQKRIEVLEIELVTANERLEDTNNRYEQALNDMKNEKNASQQWLDSIKQELVSTKEQLKKQQEIANNNVQWKNEHQSILAQKTELMNELEQSKEHCQRLVKEHARLEQRFDNLQDEMELQQKEQRAMSIALTDAVPNANFVEVDSLGAAKESRANQKYEIVKKERDEFKRELKRIASESEIRGKTQNRLLRNEVDRLTQMERQYWEVIAVNALLREHISSIGSNTDTNMAAKYKKTLEENEHLRKQLTALKPDRDIAVPNTDNLKEYPYGIDDPTLNYDGDLNSLVASNKYLRTAVRGLEQKLDKERNEHEKVTDDKSKKEVIAENEELRLRCASMESVIESLKSQMKRELRKIVSSSSKNQDSRRRTSSTSTLNRQPHITGPNAGHIARSISTDIKQNSTTNRSDDNEVTAGLEKKSVAKTKQSDITEEPIAKVTHRQRERKCWIQFRRQDIASFIKLLVHAKPQTITVETPTSLAFVLFMCLRYADFSNDDRSVQALLTNYINGIRTVIKKHKSDVDMIVFWLANTCRLTHLIRQYSGEESSDSEVHRWFLQNFNLDDYCQVLSDLSVRFYQELVRNIQERLQSIIVRAMLEAELIPEASPSKFFKNQSNKMASSVDVTVITKDFTDLLKTLRKYGIEDKLIEQVFRQIFYFIAAYMLNNMLLRKDMCNWSKGMQIRYNISQLEEWCRTNNLSDSGALEALDYVTQATQLLQVSKKTQKDIDGIFDLCNRLNPLQIQKILTMYMPINEFEDRVPASIIQYVAAHGGTQNSNYNLMMDLNYLYPVTFHYSTSDIKLENITIPIGLNLEHYLTIC